MLLFVLSFFWAVKKWSIGRIKRFLSTAIFILTIISIITINLNVSSFTGFTNAYILIGIFVWFVYEYCEEKMYLEQIVVSTQQSEFFQSELVNDEDNIINRIKVKLIDPDGMILENNSDYMIKKEKIDTGVGTHTFQIRCFSYFLPCMKDFTITYVNAP